MTNRSTVVIAGPPTIVARVVVGHLGLQSTSEIFGSSATVVPLIVAVEAWRTRPTRMRALRAAPVTVAGPSGAKNL